MAVNLSPYGGVGAQFLDNSGNVLTGGKIYTYTAGTTTPQPTYTTSGGNIPHTNPIILDAAGRVPSGGEIWLTDGLSYKFILRDANDVLIATYDNVLGINSNFVAFTNQQEIQTATAGQTVFNLTTMQYQPGTNSLTVFVDGVNQYGPGAQYAYVETDSDTVTFVNGLHVGAEVKFTTSQLNSSASTNTAAQIAFTGFKGQVGTVQDLAGNDGSNWIGFNPDGTSAIARSAQDKMREVVSVKDFGAIGNDIADDTLAIQNAIAYTLANGYKTLHFPAGTYKTSASLTIAVQGFNLVGDGALSTKIKPTSALTGPCIEMGDGTTAPRPSGNMVISGLFLDGSSTTNPNADGLYMFCSHLEVRDCIISQFAGHGINAFDSYSNKVTHCRIFDCGKNGINLIQAPNIFEISWNYILGNANHGIYASGGNSLVIYGNDIEQNQYNGIRLIGNGTSAMRNVSVYNNYFELNSIDVGYPDAIYSTYGVGEISGLAVENNYFEGNGIINIQDINSAVVKNNVNGTLKVNFLGYQIFTENQLVDYSVGNNGQLSAYTNHNGTDGFTIEGRCTGIRLFTKEAGVESTVFSAKRAFPGDIGRGFIDGYWQMTAISPTSAVNNSLYIDVLTGKLTFKDSGGVSHALY